MAAEEQDSGPGIPEWVVTFGDMMSLLLTFFIMLVSLSEIKEEEKYQAMVESMQQQFGYETSLSSVIPGENKPRNSSLAKLATAGRAKRLDTMQGGDAVQAPVGDHPQVRIVRPGNKTAVGTVVFFDEEAADLQDEQREVLRQQVVVMGGKPQKIEIRGHTSRKPVAADGTFADNWELAFRRSRNVFDFLTNEMNIDPQRIRISVAGPNEPMHISPDPVKQRQNPRVEVFMLDEVVDDLSGTRKEQEDRFRDEGTP